MLRREGELRIIINEHGADHVAIMYRMHGQQMFAHLLSKAEALYVALSIIRKAHPVIADHVEAITMQVVSTKGLTVHKQ